MTALLEQVITRASALPDGEQERIAVQFLEILDAEDDRRWDQQFEDSQDVLETLADQAIAHIQAGRTTRISA
jgi:hypothetical protein